MIRGFLSPRFNDFITNPYFTSVEKKVDPVEKNSGPAIDGTLHIEYKRDENEKLIKSVEYKIDVFQLTKEDSDILKTFDGIEITFYPHSDSGIKYKAVPDMNWYHKKNMYFHDGCIIKIIVNENDFIPFGGER